MALAIALAGCASPDAMRVRVLEVQTKNAQQDAAAARSKAWGLEQMLEHCQRSVNELWDRIQEPAGRE